MKRVDLADANRTLADYAREAKGETLVVTRRGKPVAAVVPIAGVDMESLALSTNPDFIGLIERSRASYRAAGGLTIEEMRHKYGIERKPRRKPARPANGRRAAAATRKSRRT